MGDFTDNTDNTFTDILENPVQEIQAPADSSNISDTPTTDTGTMESDVQVTPTPTPENEVPVSVEDENKEDAENSVSSTYTIDDIYSLLSDLKAGNEEYQTKILENQTYLVEQTRNILSVSSLLLLTIGFASGILLARIVWRKL